MLPRLCVAVAGPAIICSLFSPTNASAQAGTLTAAVAGVVPVPIGPLVDNRNVGVGGQLALRYAAAAVPNAALRLELSGLLPSSHDNGGTDQNTTLVANGSSALMAMAGPEFDVASFGGHFYTTATAGAARIWATSAASSGPTPAYGPFAATTGRGSDQLRVEWWRRIRDEPVEWRARRRFRPAVLRSWARDVRHDISGPHLFPRHAHCGARHGWPSPYDPTGAVDRVELASVSSAR